MPAYCVWHLLIPLLNLYPPFLRVIKFRNIPKVRCCHFCVWFIWLVYCRDKEKKVKTLGAKANTVDTFVVQSPVIVSVSYLIQYFVYSCLYHYRLQKGFAVN